MNRRFKVAIFFLLIGTYSQAQDMKWLVAPSLGIDMGGAVIIPFSDIPDGAKGSPRLMPNIGLGFQYSIHNRWNIGIEANYHVLAFTASADVLNQPYYSDDGSYATYFSGETQTDAELRFVEFPALAFFTLNQHWSLVFGVYYARIIEAKFEVAGTNGWISGKEIDPEVSPLPGTQNVTYNFNDDMRSYDAGAILGFQYKIGAKVLFWGRFHVGMKSIFHPDFQNISYEMYQMRLSTGVSFALFSKARE